MLTEYRNDYIRPDKVGETIEMLRNVAADLRFRFTISKNQHQFNPLKQEHSSFRNSEFFFSRKQFAQTKHRFIPECEAEVILPAVVITLHRVIRRIIIAAASRENK